MCKKPGYWGRVGHDIVPGSKLCPQAVIQYARKPQRSLVTDIRMHLSSLGWKIEFSREGGIIRFKYTSPVNGGDGRPQCYLSLHKLCLDLRASMRERDVGAEMQKENKKELLVMPQEEEEEEEVVDGNCSVITASSSSRPCFYSSNDVVVFEPKCCPQAVVDWCSYDLNRSGKTRDLTLMAKKHLAYMGWKFWYGRKGENRRELRYTSPTGVTYYSLKAACNGFLDGGGGGSGGVAECVESNANVLMRVSYATAIECSSVSNLSKRKRKDDLLAAELTASKKLRSLKDEKHNSSKRRKEFQTSKKLREGIPRMLRSSKRVRHAASSSINNPRTILSWLIDSNVVLPKARVKYFAREVSCLRLEGRVTHKGIKCSCCQRVISLSEFEMHASGGTSKTPAASIFLDDGRSLLHCQMQLIRVLESETGDAIMNDNWSQGDNDEVCSICLYGGELILCDNCPSSFHHSCLGLKNVPDGSWFCSQCCCGICRQRKFGGGSQHIVNSAALLSCYQCNCTYHVGCLSSIDRLQNHWFCSTVCKQTFIGLWKLVGKAIPLGVDNLTWKLLKHSNELETLKFTEIYSKLKLAVGVMHECFEPVRDSGRDLIEDVIFSRVSRLNRLNFQGFYTIVLERNDELVSVAVARVHGRKVTEMPLVGTRLPYRRQGMCRILMNEFIKQLRVLSVEKIILPAVPSVLKTWTKSFGFSIMTEFEKMQYLNYTFLDFQDTVMCQKSLL